MSSTSFVVIVLWNQPQEELLRLYQERRKDDADIERIALKEIKLLKDIKLKTTRLNYKPQEEKLKL